MCFGIGDVIVSMPLVLGVIGNVVATTIGNLEVVVVPLAIVINGIQLSIFNLNIFLQRSVILGKWAV